MKEVYILNKGDTLSKVKYEYSIHKNLVVANDKILGMSYVELASGSNDVIVVKNYLPFYVYKVSKKETLLDIMARGFDVGNISEVKENDLLILSKPKSLRHIVKPLEKLDDIADKFGIQKNYIMQTNNLNSEKLFVGQILWV